MYSTAEIVQAFSIYDELLLGFTRYQSYVKSYLPIDEDPITLQFSILVL